jgi:hypothetical protein
MSHSPRERALEERIAELERRREALYLRVLNEQRRRFQEGNVVIHQLKTVQENNHQKRKVEDWLEKVPESRKRQRTH